MLKGYTCPSWQCLYVIILVAVQQAGELYTTEYNIYVLYIVPYALTLYFNMIAVGNVRTKVRFSYKLISLVPRPHPAFSRLQYGKAGRALYLFSRE